MPLSRETQEQLQKAIEKMAGPFVTAEETTVTDFHLKVNGENGEVTILNDDDDTLARVHIKEWEGVHDDAVHEKGLRSELEKMHKMGKFDSLNIAKPYSFLLTDEDNQAIVDLLIVDDDTMILSNDLLAGFDEEMNSFLKHLLED